MKLIWISSLTIDPVGPLKVFQVHATKTHAWTDLFVENIELSARITQVEISWNFLIFLFIKTNKELPNSQVRIRE